MIGVVKVPGERRARHRAARARRRADPRQPVLHVPGATAGRRENRTDVTALPYGPSVPHMFIVVFVVMLPVYLNTKDAMQAWQAGLAWAFMIGVIVMIGAFVGPYIRKLTPRAAMLGTLAGISHHVHLDAARRADVGGGLDRPARDGDHPDRLLHGHEAAVRHSGRAGRTARRHGDRLDRRLHVGARRRRRRCPTSRSASPICGVDMLFSGSGASGAAARHRNTVGRLQLHRGDEQRRERRRRRRQLQPAQRAARRRRGRRASVRRSVRRSRPRSTSAIPAGRMPAAGPATRWPAAS